MSLVTEVAGLVQHDGPSQHDGLIYFFSAACWLTLCSVLMHVTGLSTCIKLRVGSIKALGF